MTLTANKVLFLLAVICFAVAFAILLLTDPVKPKLWEELVSIGLAFGFAGFLVP